MKVSFIVGLVLILIAPMPVQSMGKVCRLILRDSTSIDAELISVRDSALVIIRHLQLDERHLRQDSSSLAVIPFRAIDSLIVPGDRHPLEGMGVGGAVGICVGGIIGAYMPMSDNGSSGNRALQESIGRPFVVIGCAMLGGVVGLFAGVIVGRNIQNPPTLIDLGREDHRAILVRASRYAEDPPGFVARAD